MNSGMASWVNTNQPKPGVTADGSGLWTKAPRLRDMKISQSSPHRVVIIAIPRGLNLIARLSPYESPKKSAIS